MTECLALATSRSVSRVVWQPVEQYLTAGVAQGKGERDVGQLENTVRLATCTCHRHCETVTPRSGQRGHVTCTLQGGAGPQQASQTQTHHTKGVAAHAGGHEEHLPGRREAQCIHRRG
eukprot:scaffold908_cov333-Prasinococcus_capsulatus_cf.AAC.5